MYQPPQALVDLFGDADVPPSIVKRCEEYEIAMGLIMGEARSIPAEILALFMSDWAITEGIRETHQGRPPVAFGSTPQPAPQPVPQPAASQPEPSWMQHARAAQAQPVEEGEGQPATPARNYEGVSGNANALERIHDTGANASVPITQENIGSLPNGAIVTFIHPQREEISSGRYTGMIGDKAMVQGSQDVQPVAVDPQQLSYTPPPSNA